MKPTVIKLEPYGDHRDAKSSTYEKTLDWEKVIYNLKIGRAHV